MAGGGGGVGGGGAGDGDMEIVQYECANCNFSVFDRREHCPECGMPGMLPTFSLTVLLRGIVDSPGKNKPPKPDTGQDDTPTGQQESSNAM